ncbi:hypothetical protein B296_00049437 [Ensete ventricosum]|uniref:Uncharacterized protein n=1 Tax=Ensete ventricosum TaxID=4639 RepID=A0A426X3F8_ENSVE|nr:hypothetical protein B296_00049437 [Ensete ventricosum]
MVVGVATAGRSPLREPYNRPFLLAAASRSRRCRPRERSRPPLRVAAPTSGAGLPCGLALATIDRPLARGLSRGLAVVGRPYMGAGCESLP